MSYPLGPDSVNVRLSRGQRLFLAFLCLCLLLILILLASLLLYLTLSPSDNSANQKFDVDEIRSAIFANIDSERIARNLETLTEQPHQAGTDANRKVAERLADIWKASGIEDVHLLEYEVLLSYPKWELPNHVSVLDANGQLLFRTTGLSTDLVGNDNSPEASIQWMAYSPEGIVQGEPVYCHFGRVQDFEQLEKEFGIRNLSGKIAMMRYGEIFRGDMVRHAHQRGAIGAIVFSDPAEIARDGPDSVYPSTDQLPPSGVQRGSTLIPIGDPLSPLLPSRKDFHKQKTIEEVKNDPKMVPQIPVLPLGYGDVSHILSQMDGPEVPPGWQGGMNFTYRVGPGFRRGKEAKEVRLEVHSSLEIRTIQNVVGYIWGSEYPDEWVLLGNHYDAWVFGAIDPNSGTSILAEVGKAFGQTVSDKGWRPRRTLVFCAWDAEEYKLIGSTEFVEEFSDVLAQRAVVYMNLDLLSSNITLDVRTVPTVYQAAVDAAKSVADPVDPKRTVYDTWRQHFPPATSWLPDVPKMGIPGGGSDHASFLNFLGIPVVDFTYRDPSQAEYPLYHSRYELPFVNEHLFDHNNLAVHKAAAQFWAELARLFADSPLLPISVTTFAHKLLAEYVEQLREPISEVHQRFPNATEAAAQQLDALIRTVNELIGQAEEFEDGLRRRSFDHARANMRLRRLEQCFVNPAMGMAREEPVKRHVLYSLSDEDSYAAAVMASVRRWIGQIGKEISEEGRGRAGSRLALELTVVQQSVRCAINTLKLKV